MSESVLLAATRKGLFRIESDATISCIGFLGDSVSVALQDPRDGQLYAALNLGHFGSKLHRSGDGGKTWQELAAPAFPEKPESEAAREKEAGMMRPNPWSLEMIWELVPGGPDQAGLLWAGTIPGGLFKSTDHGESWELVRSLWDRPERLSWFGGGYDQPGIHSICVDPRDSAHITLAVSCGGVWESTDTGANWTLLGEGIEADYMPPEMKNKPEIQDVHRMTQCPGAPDHFWAQHHNGIFYSQDGAKHWSRIANAKPAAFGFGVAVHPHDPETAWFAPGIKDERRVPVDHHFVISRTRDGGASFEILSAGLPPAPSYDLVYRHGLAVDSTGERLAAGSTTGNLWVSKNGGGAWQTISQNLPPIHGLWWV